MSGIFISYRRSVSKHLARSIFLALQQRGHDVFLDVNSIDSGAFDGIILNQIAARPHFLLVLSSGALERCSNEDDWLRLEIEEAFRLNRNIVPIFDEGFDIGREKQYLPEPIRTQLPLKNAPPYSHYYFDAFIQTLSDRFFKDKVDNLPVTPTPHAERAEVQKRIEQAAGINDKLIEEIENPPTKFLPPGQPGDLGDMLRISRSAQPLIWGVENILPPPFEWVYIPPGNVKINNQDFPVDVFNIAKYPITNAQFEVFIQADDGYKKNNWWGTESGERDWHQTPLLRAFPEDDHPRANVSYYEALAFCKWLEHRFNAPSPNLLKATITLATQYQWQRAAQGNIDRKYPWGHIFEAAYCNTEESNLRKTTPVTQYSSGASSYGVMDMVGNVWEWCLGASTGADPKKQTARGGAWNSFRESADILSELVKPTYTQDKSIGFRIVMINS